MALTASFVGKRVLITGAANGLGRDLVKRLCADQAIVIAVDKDADGLESLNKEFPGITTYTIDLKNWNETRNIIDNLDAVDILVNNAGMLKTSPFLQITEEHTDLLFDVNFKPMINVSQSVAIKMIAKKIEGIIVNISSLGSKYTMAELGMYSCTKSAINMLTKSMAIELGEHNIRVNAVGPRSMKTGMYKAIPTTDVVKVVRGRSIIKRSAETKEAVDAILFLASPLSTMITGDVLYLDGGISTN